MEFKTNQKAEHLGKHFTVGELWLDQTMPTLIIDPKLVDALDAFMDHFGCKPKFVTPRSIYCKSGHTSGSYHYKGMAADLCVPGVTPLELAQFAETLPYVHGIGVYEGWDVKGRHIHIDVRPGSRACWWVKTSGSNTPGFGPSTVYKKGHRSPYIILIQKALGIKADGDYNPNTEGAVRAYQIQHALSPDGKAGPKTIAALGMTK